MLMYIISTHSCVGTALGRFDLADFNTSGVCHYQSDCASDSQLCMGN